MSHCRSEHSEDEHSCESEHGHCHGSDHEHEGWQMAEGILCLAKSAQKDLLKEKMQKLLEAKIGKKLDQVAAAAVEALLAHWQQKVAEEHVSEHYKEKLQAAFKS